MEKTYVVYGLHCGNCSDKLEKELNAADNLGSIRFDKKSKEITINDEKYLERAKLIVSANGAFMLSEDDIHEHEEHDHEGHEHHESEHAHHHGHGHHHGHSHSHFIAGESSSRNIGIAFFLNLIFSIAEFIFGTIFNSVAIMTDAVHDLGDALSIGVSWVLQKISTKEADSKYADGYGRFSLLGSLFTGVVLIGGSVLMIFRSIPRLINPEPVDYNGMLVMAVAAIAMNVYAGYLMSKGSSKNEKMLSFHMLEDVLGWAAVLVVAFVLRFTDWYILDPILSILIAAFILYKILPEFIESSKVFMNIVPKDIDMDELKEKILKIDNVQGITNLHTHSLDGENNHFSAVLFVNTKDVDKIEEIKDKVRLELIEFNVTKTTIEVIPDLNGVVKNLL